MPTELGPIVAPRFNVTFNANMTLVDVGFASPDPQASNCWNIKHDSSVYHNSPGFESARLDLVGPPEFRAAYVARCGSSAIVTSTPTQPQ